MFPILVMPGREEFSVANYVPLSRQLTFLEAEHMVNVPRAVLADDHKLVAKALSKLIAPQFEVVAIASDGYELLEFATSLKPDVIVVDVAMPLLNGWRRGANSKKRCQASS